MSLTLKLVNDAILKKCVNIASVRHDVTLTLDLAKDSLNQLPNILPIYHLLFHLVVALWKETTDVSCICYGKIGSKILYSFQYPPSNYKSTVICPTFIQSWK